VEDENYREMVRPKNQFEGDHKRSFSNSAFTSSIKLLKYGDRIERSTVNISRIRNIELEESMTKALEELQ
jgi:uridine kinase